MEAREHEQTKRKQSRAARRLQKSFISSGANWLCGREIIWLKFASRLASAENMKLFWIQMNCARPHRENRLLSLGGARARIM